MKYKLPKDEEPKMVGESTVAAQQYAADLQLGMEVLHKMTPEDLHSIVLYISNFIKKEEGTESLGSHIPYTKEELLERIRKSEDDIKAGRLYSFEEVTEEMESKYPWLSI